MMLSQSTRRDFKTLLDAVTLTQPAYDKIAITYLETGKDPVEVSRLEFSTRIQFYASAMQNRSIKPRDLLIIAHTQNLESIFAFWGAIVAGAIPSMFPTLTEKLDPEIYMSGMRKLVDLSAVQAILTSDDFAPQLAEHVTCPVYGSDAIHSVDTTGKTFMPYSPVPSDTAFLQHSSGTTGLQKGVALSHSAVLNHIASYSDSLALTAEDVIVSWLPLYHDMGLIAGFLMPLIQGTHLVLMSPFDWVSHPAMLLRAITDYNGTLTWLPNFAYNHCARRIRRGDLDGIDLSSMRAFINCSEPARATSHAQFLDRFQEYGVTPEMLAVSYAMAENTFAVTQTPIGQIVTVDAVNRQALEQDLRATPTEPDSPGSMMHVSCGPPVAGVKVEVVNDAGETLPERHVGELKITSDSLLTEYYRRDDLQPLDDAGWFMTGDRGYIADGEVYVIGRSKDLIINAGKNVYPQDIEAVVNQVDGVHPGRAVVFGVPDEREGTELIGVVAEIDTDDSAEQKRINKSIRQMVVSHTEVTVSYVKLVPAGWLIKTSSGKIARAANRDKWLAERKK